MLTPLVKLTQQLLVGMQITLSSKAKVTLQDCSAKVDSLVSGQHISVITTQVLQDFIMAKRLL